MSGKAQSLFSLSGSSLWVRGVSLQITYTRQKHTLEKREGILVGKNMWYLNWQSEMNGYGGRRRIIIVNSRIDVKERYLKGMVFGRMLCVCNLIAGIFPSILVILSSTFFLLLLDLTGRGLFLILVLGWVLTHTCWWEREMDRMEKGKKRMITPGRSRGFSNEKS